MGNKTRIYSNYKRKNKWMGIIDYKSLMCLFIYLFIVWNLINLLGISIEYKIYIFLFLSIPVTGLLLVNINSESPVEVLYIILRYMFLRKIYLDLTDIDIKKQQKKMCIYK